MSTKANLHFLPSNECALSHESEEMKQFPAVLGSKIKFNFICLECVVQFCGKCVYLENVKKIRELSNMKGKYWENALQKKENLPKKTVANTIPSSDEKEGEKEKEIIAAPPSKKRKENAPKPSLFDENKERLPPPPKVTLNVFLREKGKEKGKEKVEEMEKEKEKIKKREKRGVKRNLRVLKRHEIPTFNNVPIVSYFFFLSFFLRIKTSFNMRRLRRTPYL